MGTINGSPEKRTTTGAERFLDVDFVATNLTPIAQLLQRASRGPPHSRQPEEHLPFRP